MRKRKRKNKHSKVPLRNMLPITTCNNNTILHHVMYPSAVRFFEGQFPHNTIITDHYEGQTSPKISTFALP